MRRPLRIYWIIGSFILLVLIGWFIIRSQRPKYWPDQKIVDVIRTDSFARNLSILSCDSFLGRKPLTIGEQRTISYLESKFRQMGLDPAFGKSYLQDVPLVEIRSKYSGMLLKAGKAGYVFLPDSDFIAFTQRITSRCAVHNAGLIFAGYGIVAPEYHWDDYAGIDVRGKVVVVLINDPGFATGDTALFRGRHMTYYGRWTYKFEEAARHGAEGCLIVHEDVPAAYPWSVVLSGHRNGNIELQAKDLNMGTCAVEGWLNLQAAKTMFNICEADYDLLKEQASQRGFHPVVLQASVSLTLDNTIRQGTSHNIGALVRGSVRPEECIVYSAHWDHLGVGKPVDGDSIYNGANDDASGVAQVLEIARAFRSLPKAPQRSVLFLVFTGEESGLLGSKYYVEHPVFALNKTVTDINFDIVSFWGRMRDVSLITYGESEVDQYVEEAAIRRHRYIAGDPFPEQGHFFRADHFSFVQKGIPTIYGKGMTEHWSLGTSYARKKWNDFISHTYHKPSDEYYPQIHDLSGAIDDTKLFFETGYRLANDSVFPAWYPYSIYRKYK